MLRIWSDKSGPGRRIAQVAADIRQGQPMAEWHALVCEEAAAELGAAEPKEIQVTENLWERARAALEHINDVCDPNEVDINLPPLLAEMERVGPVLLIPDDGSRVVVSREEWERKREAAERILFNFLISYDSGGCCSPSTSTQEVEAHAARLAAAIVTPEEHGHD